MARGLLAMVAGYGLIVLMTSLGFNVWLGGANLYTLGMKGLAQATLIAIIAGLAGGYLAGLIGGRHPLPHAALVLIPLVIDTAYVLFWFESETPLWFDAAGSATLMTFTIGGGALRRFQRRPKT